MAGTVGHEKQKYHKREARHDLGLMLKMDTE